jgi:hypothetical protein
MRLSVRSGLAMANMKIVELIAASSEEVMAAVAAGFVSENDLKLAINLIDDEIIELRERLDRLEQGGGAPATSA